VRLPERVVKLAEVIPFRGLRYNPEAVPDISRVVSPPYDIISPEQQKHFHDRHSHNAIHLEYGMELPDDDGENNRYARAAATLRRWLDERVLLPDRQPSFYFCRERYRVPGGGEATREGFLGAVRLVDFSEGVVLPHEHTHAGPKEDRLRLLEATMANLSPVYSLYPDPGHDVTTIMRNVTSARPPQIDFSDDDGTRQQLWVVSDPDVTRALSSALAERKLFIADGHHRYETALAYSRMRREAGDAEGSPHDYLMMYLSSMDDETQPILPVHRFVSGLGKETLDLVEELLEREFEVSMLPREGESRATLLMERLEGLPPDRNGFGVYVAAGDRYFTVKARRPRPLLDAGKSGHSEAWRSLDVAVLDRLLLKEMLGIGPGGGNEGASVRYVERTDQALALLGGGGFDIAFLVRPTTMAEIRSVARSGEKMPQKSTYFYPKPLTGLVFRSIDN
jgi:uncharacterized protein (DUF1015 family)